MNIEQAQNKTFRPPQGQRILNWFNPLGRGLGMIAFVLNRITGIGLVVYLGFHLVVLSLLAGGEGSWDSFVALARSPIFLMLDVILIAGILIHGLNGIRVALVGLGFGTRTQKPVFVGLMVIAVVALVYLALRVFAA